MCLLFKYIVSAWNWKKKLDFPMGVKEVKQESLNGYCVTLSIRVYRGVGEGG